MGVGEALETERHDHEFLNIDRVVRVRTAVNDVHHRGRQQSSADAAHVAEQRQTAVIGSRTGDGQRNAEDGIRAEVFLVFAAVQFDHAIIDGGLIESVHPTDFVGQLVVDVIDSRQNALAHVDGLVAVAKFPGFVDAGAGTARNRRAAE